MGFWVTNAVSASPAPNPGDRTRRGADGQSQNARPPISNVRSGHRFYRPGMGRWVSRDPVAEDGGPGLNVFCGNDPTIKIDPFGFESVCCCRGKVVSELKISSGVIINKYAGPDPRVHERRQFVHYWISWPGGSADANADFDNMVNSPANGPKVHKRTAYEPPKLVSLCEVDLVALWNCLAEESGLLRGKKCGINACMAFAKDRMLGHCMKKSKGCTNPDEVKEYLSKVPRSLF